MQLRQSIKARMPFNWILAERTTVAVHLSFESGQFLKVSWILSNKQRLPGRNASGVMASRQDQRNGKNSSYESANGSHQVPRNGSIRELLPYQLLQYGGVSFDLARGSAQQFA